MTAPFSDSWFDLDPEPKFLVNENGRVAAKNPAGLDALNGGQVSLDGMDVLRFGSARSDSAFLSALKISKPEPSWRDRLVLRARDGGWLSASLFRRAHDPMAILSFRAETSPAREAFDALANAFHLTQAELDVLYNLMKGRCPKEIASALEVSEHTVRAHLRLIYTKMEVKGLTGTIRRASLLI